MRLKGLDSIRIICAIIVVFGHLGGPPILTWLDENNFFQKLIIGLYNNFYNGPAAVIVFFVISGLVIHFPYAQGKKFNYSEFLVKRYLRIGLPMLAIFFIALAIE